MTESKAAFLRLEELERTRPELAGPLAYYRRLIPRLHAGQPLAPLPDLLPAAALERLRLGQPLLEGFQPVFNPGASKSFFLEICRTVAEFQPAATEAISATNAGHLQIAVLLAGLICGDLGMIEHAANEAEVAPLTLRMLLEYTLRPTLRSWQESLLAGADLAVWQRPNCPVCGSQPLLAEWHKTQHLRLLRCSLCGCGWPFPLRKCARCGSEDPASQGILSGEPDDPWLAQTCKLCRGYIKTIRVEGSMPHDLMALEDLITFDLDQGCQARGYSRFGETIPPTTNT